MYFVVCYGTETDLEGDGGGGERTLPIICHHLFFFWNHFEGLQTVLIEVELVMSNAPLTHVSQNAIKTFLTSNHLSFGRQ